MQKFNKTRSFKTPRKTYSRIKYKQKLLYHNVYIGIFMSLTKYTTQLLKSNL